MAQHVKQNPPRGRGWGGGVARRARRDSPSTDSRLPPPSLPFPSRGEGRVTRRVALALFGTATIWPLATRAEQASLPVIGFLSSRGAADSVDTVAAFRRGLGDSGFIEGENVIIEFRWAEGRYDRLPDLAAELVRRPVALMVATGGDPSVLTAKAATADIPVVFTMADDPVKRGIVASFSRPGGNMTGVSLVASALAAKQFALLSELVPTDTTMALLVNPTWTSVEQDTSAVAAAARARGTRLLVLNASNDQEIETAFATLVERRAGALLVETDSYLNRRRDLIASLAARAALPALLGFREFAAAGGLMSYGPDLAEGYRQIGIYAGRILRGAKPADLPVLQPTKFELVINLKTAKALHLEIPASLLAIADEVIE